MTGIYGWSGSCTRRVALPPPYTACAPPLPPEKVYNDYSPQCIGCPYPRHGLMCRSADSEKCLREDMRELEEKWLAERREKKTQPELC